MSLYPAVTKKLHPQSWSWQQEYSRVNRSLHVSHSLHVRRSLHVSRNLHVSHSLFAYRSINPFLRMHDNQPPSRHVTIPTGLHRTSLGCPKMVSAGIVFVQDIMLRNVTTLTPVLTISSKLIHGMLAKDSLIFFRNQGSNAIAK